MINIVTHLSNLCLSSSTSTPRPKQCIPAVAKGDSGAIDHYVPKNLAPYCFKSISKDCKGTIITYLHGETVATNEKGDLQFSDDYTTTATIIPGLKQALISLGKLCDEDCTVLIQQKKLTVYRNGTILMTGVWNFQDGLYNIHLHPLHYTNNTSITTDNVQLLMPHALIKNKTTTPTKAFSTYTISPKKKTKYNHIFDSFNTLIDEFQYAKVFDHYKPIVEQEKQHHANVILCKDKAKALLAACHHTTCFSPVTNMFLQQ